MIAGEPPSMKTLVAWWLIGGLLGAAAPVEDVWRPLPPGAVRLGGDLGAAIETALTGRVLAGDLAGLVEPFAKRDSAASWWRSEFWGKWAASVGAGWWYRPTPELRDLAARAASALGATQTPDGYIGDQAERSWRANWDVWGRKYTLLGLLACHEATGDPASLAAARKLADHLLAELDRPEIDFNRVGQWTGLAAGSIIEPLVLLHRATGDGRYLAFAERIATGWAREGGPDLITKALAGIPVYAMFPGPRGEIKGYGDAGQSKAYEMMSCYEGLLELYRATGQPRYRDAASAAWRLIIERERTILGSGSDWERWNDGRLKQHLPWREGIETCVTVYWLKLNEQLLRLTGDPAYADELEWGLYNALMGAQMNDGRWWVHHTPLAGVKHPAPEQCRMRENCCVANGPRGLLLAPRCAVMRGPAGPVINLYGDAEATIPLAPATMTLTLTGGFPVGDRVTVAIGLDRPAETTLTLRLPGWSEGLRVTVNGEPVAATPGTCLPLTRTWREGDRLELAFDLTCRLQKLPEGNFGAVCRGPVVLARDARFADLDQPFAAAPGRLESRRLEPPAGIRQLVEVAGEKLIDVASAGNTWTAASRYRVWLPLAE